MSPRSQRASPFRATQVRNNPSGACATGIACSAVQLEPSSLTPAMGGDRKYLGSYLLGEPQNTSLPHDVVPKT